MERQTENSKELHTPSNVLGFFSKYNNLLNNKDLHKKIETFNPNQQLFGVY